MRVACSLLLLAGIAFAQTASNSSAMRHPLTNQDVITLAQAGFDESFIIQHIRTAHIQFDTTVEGLVTLKKAGLDEDVIQAMVAAEQKKIQAAAPPTPLKQRGHWWRHTKPVPITLQ